MGKLIIIAQIKSPRIREMIRQRKQERWAFQRNRMLAPLRTNYSYSIADVIPIK